MGRTSPHLGRRQCPPPFLERDMTRLLVRASAIFAALSIAALGCSDDDDSPTGINTNPDVVLANHSTTPALIKNLPAGVTAFSLIGSDDVLSGSPNFVFGGSADGAGLLKNADGTFTMIVNHEDNFAVSRIRARQDVQAGLRRLHRQLDRGQVSPLLRHPRHSRGTRVRSRYSSPPARAARSHRFSP